MNDSQSRDCDEATQLLLSCFLEQTRPMLCRNCQKNAEARQTSTGSLNAKAMDSTHGLDEAPNANHHRKETLRQRGDYSSTSKAANKIGPNAASTPINCRSSKKRKRSKKQYVPTAGPLEINFGNGNEDREPEENKVEIIDEAEFMKKKTHYALRIQPSVAEKCGEGYAAAASQKNVKSKSRKMSSKNVCVPFSPKGADFASEQGDRAKLSSILRKDKNNESMKSKEHKLKEADKHGLRFVKPPFVQKIWFPTEQPIDEGCSLAFCWKNVDVLDKKRSSGNVDDIYDTDKTRESRSFSKEGKNKKDMDPAEAEFMRIDEAEFENRNTDMVPKMRALIRKDGTQGSSAANFGVGDNGLSQKIPSTRNGDETRKKQAVSHPKIKKDDGERNLSGDNERQSVKKISSSRRNPSNRNVVISKNINGFQQDEGINYSRPETIHGVASQARSRTRIMSKAREVGSVLLDLLSLDNNNNNDDDKADGKIDSSDSEDYFTVKDFNFPNTNDVLVDGADAGEGLKEQSDVIRKSSSKHCNYLQDPDKAVGADAHQSKDQPEINGEGLTVSTTNSKDENSVHSDDEELGRICDMSSSNGSGDSGEVGMADEISHRSNEKQCSSKHNDVCQILADSVLGRGQLPEMEKAREKSQPEPESQTHCNLPLKFRFEDEVPKPVEKTEYEKQMDGFFDELNINWALSEVHSVAYPEVDQENEEAAIEETQYSRCCRGKHELVFVEDAGLECIYCNKLVLESRYVLPQWAEKICGQSAGKKSSGREKLPEFDELYLQSLMSNSAKSSFSSNGTVWNIKPGVKENMYQHQQEGFEFLWKNLAGSINLAELNSCDPNGVGGCIISHAPGTGKTRLTIVFIETYLKVFPSCRPVIIAPASMLLTWEEEFKKWNVEFPFHNLNNPEFSGKENKAALGLLGGATCRNLYATRMVKIFSWNEGMSVLGISYTLYETLTTGEKSSKLDPGKKRKREEGKKAAHDKNMKTLGKILFENPGLVFLDEGHTPRNRRSNIWNALFKLHTRKRVILSGTPFQNNFAELFNIMRLVSPATADLLCQERTFAEQRRKNKKKNIHCGSVPVVNDNAVEKLKAAISPFVHVHKGTILQQSLPGLDDCVILLKPPPLQKSLIEKLGSPKTLEFEHKVALTSVHPYFFKFCDSTNKQMDEVQRDAIKSSKLNPQEGGKTKFFLEQQMDEIQLDAIESSKLNPHEGGKTKFILELVRFSMATNEKVLVFSQYIQPLELIRKQLTKIFRWVDGKHILQMEGIIDQRHRQILINMFNNPDSEAKVMLASTKCCSEGISLVGASRVVLLDVLWNPSVERQAISRAYRIGQKKIVYTYHLMTSGTTEAEKYCKQAEKERLSELVFSSSSNESSHETLHASVIEDRILEEMLRHPKLKDMFERIIHQPKNSDLIETFGLIS